MRITYAFNVISIKTKLYDHPESCVDFSSIRIGIARLDLRVLRLIYRDLQSSIVNPTQITYYIIDNIILLFIIIYN